MNSQSITLLVLAFAAMGNFFIAAFVLSKNWRATAHRALFLLAGGMAAWIFGIVLLSATGRFVFDKLILYGGIVTVLGIFIFAKVFPSEEKLRKDIWLHLLPFAVLAALVPRNVFIKETIVHPGGMLEPINGSLFPLYAGILGAYIFYSFFLLIRTYVRVAAAEKKRMQYFFIGAAAFFSIAFLFDIFLPALGVFAFNLLGPLASVFFAGLTGYAILRHRFLDIKIIVVEFLVGVLLVVLAIEVASARSLGDAILAGTVFLGTLAVGIFLVRGVRSEVRHREELERLSAALARANQNLEKLSTFKSQLLSLVSHQIKSPLSIIDGYLSLLLEGSYGKIGEKPRGVLERAKGSARDLVGLIENLLDYRRIEEGRIEYAFERVDARGILSGIFKEFEETAKKKKIRLIPELPERPLYISADKQKLSHAVRNIVDNALKYTPKGFVRGGLHAEGRRAVFTIEDSGAGISATLLPRLFDEFVRGDHTKDRIQGSGFGLYIAKKIIEAHGGSVSVASPGEGKGSSFSIYIPLYSENGEKKPHP